MSNLETKYYRLEKLVKWDKIDEVNEMIMSGVSPRQVSNWCKENGFDISHPKLYEYRDMLREAVNKQITVEQMLGITGQNRNPILLQSLGITPVKEIVKSELDVLDGIIQLGFNTLKSNPSIRMGDAMKAIELKNKITGGSHGGLTNFGLEQLRELEQAKFTAILEVVLQYLPEDKHEEVYEAMAEAEHRFYVEEAPDFLEDYENKVQQEMDEINANKQADTKF